MWITMRGMFGIKEKRGGKRGLTPLQGFNLFGLFQHPASRDANI